MKIIILILMIGPVLYDQNYTNMFEPNTIYLERGSFDLSYYTDVYQSNGSYQKYKPIVWRTIAVDPTKILPGSVVFIPEMAGQKLPEGTYHDGYFLAHRVLEKYPSNKISIYHSEKAPLIKHGTVYIVFGAMDKAVRLRFKKQYEIKKDLKTFEMVSSDFTSLMNEGNRNFNNINERLQYYSEKGKGTPYLVFNLGEGAESFIDPDPTIDFARTDCMTFCEHTLALAISKNYSEMYNNLQKIRYKGGQIGYVTRNHYTLVDWLPNNNWLLEDVTKEVAEGKTKSLTKTIDRPAFYKNNGVPDPDLANAPGTAKVTLEYIPKNKILSVAKNLKGGEIFSIITKHPAVFSAHMGFVVIDQWGNVILRHASSLDETSEVLDERLSDYIERLQKSKSRVGIVFMRVKEDYKIPQ